jgi:hypothetical protein
LRKRARRLVVRLTGPAARRSRQRGQGLAEFALVIPIMFFLAVAIGDFGRVFSAMTAVESAAREAADYGAFVPLATDSTRWASANWPWATVESEMERRACTATGELSGFSDSTGTCKENPDMDWELLTRDSAGSAYHVVDHTVALDDCSGRPPLDARGPCIVHVWVSFDFTPIFAFPPIPSTVNIRRDSWFAVSELTGS